jgi:hypothetical protein
LVSNPFSHYFDPLPQLALLSWVRMLVIGWFLVKISCSLRRQALALLLRQSNFGSPALAKRAGMAMQSMRGNEALSLSRPSVADAVGISARSISRSRSWAMVTMSVSLQGWQTARDVVHLRMYSAGLTKFGYHPLSNFNPNSVMNTNIMEYE